MKTNDVEKRWHDPRAARLAVAYCAAVVGLAVIAGAAFLATDRSNLVVATAVPGVCLVGGIGALVIAYRAYRRGGTWPFWQGAGWFLFALMLVTMSLPMTAR